MILDDYGWAPSFARHLEDLIDNLPPASSPGRVISPGRGLHRVMTACGEVAATLTGRLEASGEVPAVGDWVVLAAGDAAGGRPAIHAVLPRRTALTRKVAGPRSEEQVLAANVDTVFFVLGLDGDFNLRRLERLAVLAGASGAEAVVLLTKADLPGADPAGCTVAAEAAVPGLPVHAVSSLAPGGLDPVRRWLAPGRTVALLGSSGAGKSTLVNRLAGAEILSTAAVRARDDRGRHTTTRRELVRLPGGALLIDNPGLREVQLWVDGEDAVRAAFADVEAIARGCRFRDCSHRHEPGCAVRDAVAQGRLDAARVENLHALEREVTALERRRDARASRRHERRLGAEYRRIQRAKEEQGRRR